MHIELAVCSNDLLADLLGPHAKPALCSVDVQSMCNTVGNKICNTICNAV